MRGTGSDMAGTDRNDNDEIKDDVVEYFGADGEDEGEKFHETGELSDVDDQTIAPG